MILILIIIRIRIYKSYPHYPQTYPQPEGGRPRRRQSAKVKYRSEVRVRQSASAKSMRSLRSRQSASVKYKTGLFATRRLIHRLSTGLLLDSRRTETGAPPSPHPSIVYHSEIDLSRDLRKIFARHF